MLRNQLLMLNRDQRGFQLEITLSACILPTKCMNLL